MQNRYILLFFLFILCLFGPVKPTLALELKQGYDHRAQEVIITLMKKNHGSILDGLEEGHFYNLMSTECQTAPFICTYTPCCSDGKSVSYFTLDWVAEDERQPLQLAGISIDSNVQWGGTGDFSGLSFLKNISMLVQDFSELDIKKDWGLESLDIRGNKITRLDLSDNDQLKTLKACRAGIREIELGENKLEKLSWIELGSCHLPLSQLAKFIGREWPVVSFGIQEDVFFELTTITGLDNAVMDFSSEVLMIDGMRTNFSVTDEYGRALDDNTIYSEQSGIITFKKAGRYKVLMTHPRISSHLPNEQDLAFCVVGEHCSKTGPVEVYSGVIKISK